MPTSKNATRYPPTTCAGKSTTHADASDYREDSSESVRSIKKNAFDGLVADESGDATHSTSSTSGVGPAKANTFHDDLEPADVNPHLYPDLCPTLNNPGAAQTASEEAVAAKIGGGGVTLWGWGNRPCAAPLSSICRYCYILRYPTVYFYIEVEVYRISYVYSYFLCAEQHLQVLLYTTMYYYILLLYIVYSYYSCGRRQICAAPSWLLYTTIYYYVLVYMCTHTTQ